MQALLPHIFPLINFGGAEFQSNKYSRHPRVLGDLHNNTVSVCQIAKRWHVQNQLIEFKKVDLKENLAFWGLDGSSEAATNRINNDMFTALPFLHTTPDFGMQIRRDSYSSNNLLKNVL